MLIFSGFCPILNLQGCKRALESSEFKDILNAMSFSNFQIDWRMFTYFRPDFYKQFLSEKADPEDEDKKGGSSRRRRHGRNSRRHHTLRAHKTQKHRHTRKNRIFGLF